MKLSLASQYILVISSLGLYYFGDQLLSEWIYLHLTSLMSYAKTGGILCSPLILLVAPSVLFLCVRFKKDRKKLSLILFEISLAQCIVVGIGRILKVLISRARPCLFLSEGITGFFPFSLQDSFQSCPSGHTLAYFAFAATLSFHRPRLQKPAYLIAFSLSLLRVFSGDHYLSDVLISACIGHSIAFFCHYLIVSIVHIHPAEQQSTKKG